MPSGRPVLILHIPVWLLLSAAIACCLNLPTVCRAEPLTIRVPVRRTGGLYPIPRYQPVRPRLMLALSGGSARGAAHIGALEALEEAGIRPDGIAGVSMGALIGGLYAAGYEPLEIKHRLEGIDWGGLLLDRPARPTLLLARKEEHSRHLLTIRLNRRLSPVMPGAIAHGQQLYRMLMELTLDAPYGAACDWDELRTPLRTLATDMGSGREVVFDEGDLALAMRGSLSLPLLFDPLTIDTLQLVDGGMISNIPVRLAREMGGEVVLAIDATARLSRADDHQRPWEIVDRVTTIMEGEADQNSLAEADIVATPVIDNSSLMGPGDIERLSQAGRAAVEDVLPELRRLLEPEPSPDDGTFLHFSAVICDFDGSSLPGAPPEWTVNQGASIGDVRRHLQRLWESGTVRDAHAEFDSSTSTLSFRLLPTPVLQGVVFGGDKLLPDTVLVRSLEPLLGRRVNYDTTRSALEEVLRIYRQQGYPAAEISGLTFDSTAGSLTVSLQVGRLEAIRFKGIRRVPQSWLSGEIPIKVGRPITRSGILKGMSNLYATGLFRSVYPALLRGEAGSGRWTLEVHMSEHPALPLRLGLAYQHERRTRGFAELVYPTPIFYAERLVLFTSVGERDQMHGLHYLVDRVASLPFTGRLSLEYNLRKRTSYAADHSADGDYRETRWGVRLDAGGEAPRWGMLTLSSRLEAHDNRYPDERKRYLLQTVGLGLRIDTQDRSPFPNRGTSARAELETGGRFLGSEREFTKLWGAWEGYLTPLHRQTFGIRLRGGTCDRTTPRDERFRLGGMHTFPGLHLDEAVGALQLAAGLEARYDLISRFLADSYIGLRYDIGGSWGDPAAQVLRRDWMSSLAIYFALDTMLGPVIIQWGHLLPGGAAKGQEVISIQAGNQF